MPSSLPFSDRPLRPQEADLLGRGPFVRNLAKVFCEAPDDASIVFALYGRWGEGKTSTLALLHDELRARETNGEPTPLVIRFNPWVFSGRERLFAAFFEDIGNAIGTSDIEGAGEKAKKWKRLGTYSNLVGQGLNHVDSVLNVFGASVPGWKLLGKFLGSVGEAAEQAAAAEDNAPERSLSSIRSELEEALDGMDRSFLVILDDLDRLPPVELVEIFQLLKSIADLPKVHYLLVCDRANIERNLTQHGLRADYLEKIVQFGVELPSIPRDRLESLLVEQLEMLFTEFAPDDTRLGAGLWKEISTSSLPGLFANLRSIKRFLGEVRILLPAFCREGHFELNPQHFLNLHALRLLCPASVTMLLEKRDLFVPKLRWLGLFDDEEESSASARRTFIDEELPRNLQESGHASFERTVREMVRSAGVDMSTSDLAAEERFLTSRLWFDAYFTFELPGRFVSRSEIKQVREVLGGTQTALDALVSTIAQRNGYTALVRCLMTYFEDGVSSHGQELLTALLRAEASDEKIGPEYSQSGVLDYFAHWVHLTPVSERESKICRLIADTRSHQFFSGILYTARDSESATGGLYRNLQPYLNSLGKATAKVIEAKADVGENLLEDGFWFSYDVWSKWGSKTKLRSWIKAVVEPDEGFRNFLLAIGGYRISHDGSGKEKEDFWLNHNRLETFPSLQDGIQRCRRLGAATEDAREKMLFKDAEAAFRDQGEYRRGKLVMTRKFPELLELRFVDPRMVNGLQEQSAIILARLDGQGEPGDGDQAELERRIASYLDENHFLTTPLQFVTSQAHQPRGAFLFSSNMAQAQLIAGEFGQPYVLMLFRDGRLLARGTNGEGTLVLASFKEHVSGRAIGI